MSNELWPALHGLSWSLKRIPTAKNAVQPGSAPGRETRVSFGPDSFDNWELEYVLLRYGSASSGWKNELERIDAFWRVRRGSFDPFLIDAGAITKNPAWSSITNQPLVIDLNGCAPLVHTIASGYPEAYDERIYELARDSGGSVIPPVIKQSGVTLHSEYVLYTPDQVDTGILNANGITYAGYTVQFVASPAITANVTADFGWRYRVRFEHDEQEWEMWHYLLWNAKQISLIGVRA